MNHFFIVNSRGDAVLFYKCKSIMNSFESSDVHSNTFNHSEDTLAISDEFYSRVTQQDFVNHASSSQNQYGIVFPSFTSSPIEIETNTKKKSRLWYSFIEVSSMYFVVTTEQIIRFKANSNQDSERIGQDNAENNQYTTIETQTMFSPSQSYEFLETVHNVIRQLLGVGVGFEVTEESVRRNLALLHEALDEMVEEGYPQQHLLSISQLRQLVANEPVFVEPLPSPSEEGVSSHVTPPVDAIDSLVVS